MAEKTKIITAFQTAGYISILAARFLEEKGVIKDVGGIDIDELAQFAVVKDGNLLSPIRILEGKEFTMITSQIPLPLKAINELADKIMLIYKERKADQIIALDGLAIDEAKDKSEVYFASTYNEKEIKNCKKLPEGAMMGFNSYFAHKARKSKIPFIVLMAETHAEIPDGIAAAALISVLEGILGIQVDTSELISEYKKTLGQINNLLKRVSQAPKSQEEQNMYV
ncbi:MAG: PAC2 family protein [Candidatus Parvarchaeota archaeon]|nr:PAC2 family protein [Candidatus Parvarchaeota archaeon]MCW1295457.1 PAC2 family protein [Candidatus Parvarchaeum tengchongense]MCW1299174.1 PAC2 family protein [Candidatus Parvarchaeum tengchongense]MCW1312242.1 PAC2 family protein [Candidatus Parvarchaeum tengchongense]